MPPKRASAVVDRLHINDSTEVLGKGSKVWVKHEDAQAGIQWLPGELRGLGQGTAEVALDSGKTATYKSTSIVPANPKLQEGIPDLTHLSYLNEPGILYNLRFRYAKNEIYTFAGPVLIALNPCKSLPLYTPEVASAYKAGARDATGAQHLAPHIYLVAATAFRRMLRERTSQSLIVNGESGAGKTETTKKAMQYFATLAGGTGVEDQVLETNPILEAFGNAKTLRNHNSSRFGKLIQIHFNQSHHICGACIKTYLLEKSRVVHQLKGERSYHIFYQLVRGAGAELRKELSLPAHPTGFRFLAQSGCTDIDGVDDAAEFRGVCVALKDVGIGPEQQAALWRLLGGVLWLGNLEFASDPNDAANDSTLLVDNEAVGPCCSLLGVSREALESALMRKRIVTPGEVIIKLLNVEESRDVRDALAKSLYSAAFDWIVKAINTKLDTGKKGSGLSIAILDIYGFEQFTRNSFEQLCINYANERLQQQFTRHLFTLEQQEYESEGIDWTKVEFIDNQECVDAIEAVPPKGLGVLAVLDAQCRFPRATDETFVHKLKEALSSHSAFGTNARAPRDFTILHYAGAVAYDSEGFLDKNKDTLNADLIELMCSSDAVSSPLVSVLGAAVRDECEANARRGGQTVGNRFSQQLRELIAELDATGLHFVRCIKPNAALKPDHFEEGMTLHQLRCCGVLEVARIARAGFPTRYTHQAFAERYAILLPPEQQAALLAAAHGQGALGAMAGGDSAADALGACKRLVQVFNLSPSQYQVGCTKIFFRPGVLGYVEDKWAAMQAAALRIQATYRMYVWRSAYLAQRNAAIVFQSVWRAKCERVAYERLIRETHAARVIQTLWRGHNARVKYVRMQRAAFSIQMMWRRSRFGKRVRRRVRDREKREMVQRLEQDSFVSLREQYNCDMDEVRAALAAWKTAREAHGEDGASDAAMALMLKAQAGNTAAASAAAGAAAGAAVAGSRSIDGGAVAQAQAQPQTPAPQAAESVGAHTPGTLSPTTSLTTPGSALAGAVMSGGVGAASARFTALQEAKEAAEKLALENMRLTKQLQLERSLKDRYQHKYEEQNVLWLEQIRVLQDYIQQVRAAFGDARLPPLPSALSAHPSAISGERGIAHTGSTSGAAAAAGMSSRTSGERGVVASPTAGLLGTATSSGGGAVAAAGAAASPFAAAASQAALAATVAPSSEATRAVPEMSTAKPETAEAGIQADLAAEAKRTAAVRSKAAAAGAAAYMMHGSDDEGDATPTATPPVRSPASSAPNGFGAAVPARPSTPPRAGASVSVGAGPQPSPSMLVPNPARALSPGRAQRAAPGGGAAAKYVGQLQAELGKVAQVLDDDVTFIAEVAAGMADAPEMAPGYELAKLRKKFDIWRREFKEKLHTAEDVLKKLERMTPGGGGARGGPPGAYSGYAAGPGPNPAALSQLSRLQMQSSVESGGPAPMQGGSGSVPAGVLAPQPPAGATPSKKGSFMGKLFNK